jgi:H+/Cl- antiporter ClcA
MIVRGLRVLLIFLGILLFSAVLSVVTTVLLVPFWSWFERGTGIESIGHSGPAQWCYVATFLMFVLVETLVMSLRRGRRDRTGAR